MCIDYVTNMIPITDNLCLIGNTRLFLLLFFCILWEEMSVQRTTFKQKRQKQKSISERAVQTSIFISLYVTVKLISKYASCLTPNTFDVANHQTHCTKFQRGRPTTTCVTLFVCS